MKRNLRSCSRKFCAVLRLTNRPGRNERRSPVRHPGYASAEALCDRSVKTDLYSVISRLRISSERPYVTFRNKIRVLYVRYRKNNVRVRYAYVRMQLQSWKNFRVSPITKSTIVPHLCKPTGVLVGATAMHCVSAFHYSHVCTIQPVVKPV